MPVAVYYIVGGGIAVFLSAIGFGGCNALTSMGQGVGQAASDLGAGLSEGASTAENTAATSISTGVNALLFLGGAALLIYGISKTSK